MEIGFILGSLYWFGGIFPPQKNTVVFQYGNAVVVFGLVSLLVPFVAGSHVYV